MWLNELHRDGCVLLKGIVSRDECARCATELGLQLEQTLLPGAIGNQREEGGVFAARNVLDFWPRADRLWRRPALINPLNEVLGAGFGLVRALFFDKPPGRNWGLPWHRDMMIAVDAEPGSHTSLGRVVLKAGVPHVSATDAVLRKMITLRLHLDDVTEHNGPMVVLPRTHADQSSANDAVTHEVSSAARPILADIGDVLFFRPMLLHSSWRAAEGSTARRRILNLEFAAADALPMDLRWHCFLTEDAELVSEASRS